MKEENKKYAREAYEIVTHAAKKIGSRLPGSENERKYANYMGDKLREIGIEPKTEEFAVSPRASIGGIPYAGYVGLALCVLTYFAQANLNIWIAMAFVSVVTLVWLVCSVFLYKTWFDMFFRQKISQNVYGELLPEDGNYDYTIFISGHTDTSWNWKHSEHAYRYKDKPILGILITYAKVGFGAVCAIFMMCASIAMGIILTGNLFGAAWAYAATQSASFNTFLIVMDFMPMICAIGCGLLIMWCDPHEENASRGAMDNATGCALSYEVIKYFKENPDKMPKNCRIVDFNCGSEEAGLRGSIAFAKEHKDDGMLKNAYHINIDSIADKDYFEAIIKDDWQFTRFDADLEKMFMDTFKELGIESKTGGNIHNPVGGCDSTPMTKAGVKSITFAAQNPVLTYYYHTWRDLPERFDVDTVHTGFDVILSVIDKIAEFQATNGYNGPQKKAKK